LYLAERDVAKHKPQNFCRPGSAAEYEGRDNVFRNNPTGKSDSSTTANEMGKLGFLPFLLMLWLVDNGDFALVTPLEERKSYLLV